MFFSKAVRIWLAGMMVILVSTSCSGIMKIFFPECYTPLMGLIPIAGVVAGAVLMRRGGDLKYEAATENRDE